MIFISLLLMEKIMANNTRPYELPPITDEKLAELYARIKPLVRSEEDGELYYIADVDPRKIAFPWSPELQDKAEGLKALGSFVTLHTWGYYGLFKPSVAEVLCQMPVGFLDDAVAFEVAGPEDSNDLNRESEALNAGFHVARTTVYGNE
jgi:hypothetical protein